MGEVLGEALLKRFRLRRSEQKLQQASEDPLLRCPWVEMRFVSLRELDFIILSLVTMM